METENKVETEWVAVGVSGWIDIEVEIGTSEERCCDIAWYKYSEDHHRLRLQELEVVSRDSW